MGVLDAIRHYGGNGNLAYVHFRNVVGCVPNYKEVFIDEGDIDMERCLRAYKAANVSGLVLIPDHTPHVRNHFLHDKHIWTEQ